MLLFSQREVLAIIGREDPTTLWDWSQNKDWFPTPNIRGRPNRWTKKTVMRWIKEGIPAMFEAGARIPEFTSRESALQYQEACLGRLQYMEEKKERQASIVKVLRVVPQTA